MRKQHLNITVSSAFGGFVPQLPNWGFAPELHWEYAVNSMNTQYSEYAHRPPCRLGLHMLTITHPCNF